MSKPISERLTPDMTRALRLGWGERGATVQGLVRRRLACPGSDTNRLRLTPMGQQWARMMVALAKVHADIGFVRENIQYALQEGQRHPSDVWLTRAEQASTEAMEAIRPLVWP